MSKRNWIVTAFATVLGAGAMTQGAVVSSTQGLGTAWVGTPQITVATNPSDFTQAETNFGTIPGGGAGQSFKVITGGTLSNIQLFVSGTAELFDISLYDGGTTDPGATYTAASNVLPAGLQFQFNDQAANNVVSLDFSSLNISMVTGHFYAFEATVNSGGSMTWVRDTGTSTYADGHAYRDRALLNGAQRDFDMAVTISVPEPASLSILGLGCVGLIARRRRI